MQHDAEPQASHGREQVVNMVRNHGNTPSQRCDRGTFYLVWRVGGITSKPLAHNRPAQTGVELGERFMPPFALVAKRENPSQCYIIRQYAAHSLAKICNNNTSHRVFSSVLV